jgi:hypothetical protein
MDEAVGADARQRRPVVTIVTSLVSPEIGPMP